MKRSITTKKKKKILITSFTGWNGKRNRLALSPHKMVGGGV
jgi:hypothetical protein